MMKRWIVVCAILVLAQVGLTVWTNLAHRGSGSPTAKGPLLAVQGARIDGLILEDAQGKKLELRKAGDHWILPGSGGFPADFGRVQDLVGKLAALQRTWPEATTTEAATRFRVAPDRFERKLTLLQQGKSMAMVYFGTSPGLRKLYFRVDKDPEIHALAIASQDLETKADNWIDTTVLHLKPEQVVAVHLPGLDLQRTKEGLQPVALHEGEELIREQRDHLVSRLTGLSISAVLGKEAKPEYGLDNPALQYSVELENSPTITYTFGQPPKKSAALPAGTGTGAQQTPLPADNGLVLKVSNQEQLLRVDGWQVDELKKATRATLIRSKAAKTPIPASTPAQTAGQEGGDTAPVPQQPEAPEPANGSLSPAPGQ